MWPAGVLTYQKEEIHHPQAEQYIREVSSRDGIDIVVCMLGELAECVHAATAVLNDNMYKHVHGVMKEWECVIWDKRLNMCKSSIFLNFNGHVLTFDRSNRGSHILQ